MKKKDQCPRTFTDHNRHQKTIYCHRWTCPICAPRKIARLATGTFKTAQDLAPLALITVRGPKLPELWNDFTQRIKRPYIGAIEHRPDPHIHAIIQMPPTKAETIWKDIGGTYWHISPVHEYGGALNYALKSLYKPDTKTRLLRSHDFSIQPLGDIIRDTMDTIDHQQNLIPLEPTEFATPILSQDPRSMKKSSEKTMIVGTDIAQLHRILSELPSGTEITIKIIKA